MYINTDVFIPIEKYCSAKSHFDATQYLLPFIVISENHHFLSHFFTKNITKNTPSILSYFYNKKRVPAIADTPFVLKTTFSILFTVLIALLLGTHAIKHFSERFYSSLETIILIRSLVIF